MNIPPSDIEFDDALVQSVDPQTDLSFLTQEPATASQAPVADGEVGPPAPPRSTDTAANEKQPETAASPASPARNDAMGSDDQRYFSLVLRDGLDLGIADLDVFVTLPDGQMCQATTSEQGAVTVPVPDQAKGQAKVEVKDATGARQEVCRLDLERCGHAVIVRSPKVKAKLPLRPHQQTPPPSSKSTKPAAAKAASASAPSAPSKPAPPPPSSWWRDALDSAWAWVGGSAHVAQKPPAAPSSATVQKTLSASGQPVTVMVGPECPNKDNLRLGKNNVYRQAIIDASARLGLIPQALCALMDCEAAKIPELVPVIGANGKPVLNKKTKKPLVKNVGDVWNPNSKADAGDECQAAGLTQFLASTWLDHVMRDGFYIHDQSVAKGWVKKEQVLKKGKPAGSRWVFVLSDGKTTPAPWQHTPDATVRECMKMRYVPTWSIIAAADYGKSNLDALKKQGFKVDQLQAMDKAKLMYLLHHEGLGNGVHFINSTFSEVGDEKLRHVFNLQVGAQTAEEWIGNYDDDVEDAYRHWLARYIDEKFGQSTKYFCCNPVTAQPLSGVLTSIGGKKI